MAETTPAPFHAHRAKRHLLNKLPAEMWEEVLGCGKESDYVRSRRVSGEYYVLMRASAREIPMAPLRGDEEALLKSLATWTAGRGHRRSGIRSVTIAYRGFSQLPDLAKHSEWFIPVLKGQMQDGCNVVVRKHLQDYDRFDQDWKFCYCRSFAWRK